MSERKRECCSSCDSHGNNLVAMGCGHRLCINCIKNVRIPASNCIVCLSSRSKKNRTSVSPQDRKNQQFSEPKTLREKILDRVRSPSTAHQISESSPDKSNRTYNPDSQNKTPLRQQEIRVEALQCREHNEPLIMYCERTKEFYCAQCLYLKNARNLNTIPIKNAAQLLQQENRLNRQESRGNLSQVESAIRVCTVNRQLFESAMRQYSDIIEAEFDEIRKALKKREQEVTTAIEQLFQTRIDEYGKVLTDLEFLRLSLKEFREHNNKENSSLNAVVYMFSAYKIIRKTVKSIDMNYVQYTPQDLSVVELDRRALNESIANFGRIKLDLPLKPQDNVAKASRINSLEKGKSRSGAPHQMHSIREQNENSQVNNSIPPKQGRDNHISSEGRQKTHSGSKASRQQPDSNLRRKQQHSLCNNIYEPPEKNLYERLLNEKFNRYK